MKKCLIFLLFLSLLLPGRLLSQSSIFVYIYINDSYNQRPVSGALVELFYGGELRHTGETDENGLALFQLTPTDVSEQRFAVSPNSFYLSPGFPNPAVSDGRAKLALSVPRQTEMRFVLYNLLGQQVSRAFEKRFFLPGNYCVEVPLSSLPAGIYFLIAEGEGILLKRKVVKLGAGKGAARGKISVSSAVLLNSVSKSALANYLLRLSHPDFFADSLIVNITSDTVLHLTMERLIQHNVPDTLYLKEGVPAVILPGTYFNDADSSYMVFSDEALQNLNIKAGGDSVIIRPNDDGAGSYDAGLVAVKLGSADTINTLLSVERMTNFEVKLYDVTGRTVSGAVIIGQEQFTGYPDSIVKIAVTPRDSGRLFVYSIKNDTLDSFGTLHWAIPLLNDYDEVIHVPLIDFDGITRMDS